MCTLRETFGIIWSYSNLSYLNVMPRFVALSWTKLRHASVTWLEIWQQEDWAMDLFQSTWPIFWGMGMHSSWLNSDWKTICWNHVDVAWYSWCSSYHPVVLCRPGIGMRQLPDYVVFSMCLWDAHDGIWHVSDFSGGAQQSRILSAIRY